VAALVVVVAVVVVVVVWQVQCPSCWKVVVHR